MQPILIIIITAISTILLSAFLRILLYRKERVEGILFKENFTLFLITLNKSICTVVQGWNPGIPFEKVKDRIHKDAEKGIYKVDIKVGRA